MIHLHCSLGFAVCPLHSQFLHTFAICVRALTAHANTGAWCGLLLLLAVDCVFLFLPRVVVFLFFFNYVLVLGMTC